MKSKGKDTVDTVDSPDTPDVPDTAVTTVAPTTASTPAAGTNGTAVAAPAPAAPAPAAPAPAAPPAPTTTTTTTKTKKKSSAPSRAQVMAQVNRGRNLVAQIVWLVCVVGALILAIAALLYAVKASSNNDLVNWMWDRAEDIDLHVFSLTHPIKDFSPAGAAYNRDPSQWYHHNEIIKEALLNYGIGAVAYLIAGRILERIIKP